MSQRNNFEPPDSGTAISIGFGAICALLLALIIWQPNVAVWMTQSAEAEFSLERHTGAPSQVAQTKRRPIEPGPWSQVITPENVSQIKAAETVGRSQKELRHAEESR